jgi:hypothetical protein
MKAWSINKARHLGWDLTCEVACLALINQLSFTQTLSIIFKQRMDWKSQITIQDMADYSFGLGFDFNFKMTPLEKGEAS